MAEICCGLNVSGGESPAVDTCETTSSSVARRRRIEIRRFKFVTGVTTMTNSDASECVETKRSRIEISTTSASPSLSFSRECDNAIENCVICDYERESGSSGDEKKPEEVTLYESRLISVKPLRLSSKASVLNIQAVNVVPKFGVASVCGRRRDMEDAVAAHPSFFRSEEDSSSELHYFAVYDGHGCSHVAMKCRDRLHELVKEELLNKEASLEWQLAMERSFSRMDKEAIAWKEGVVGNCRCELQTPECDAVGSTAVVAIVTPDKIIVANCGDSRAVLCRNGKAVPLSSDHKPDRPDELNRIQEAGGRVIFWDGPRVLGVLAMSRAIGDNYLKPYVSCEPEVTITDRTSEDDCLILASDGLWDVVSNHTACGVARMCLRGKMPPAPETISPVEVEGVGGDSSADKACSDASMLLTKLALARHSTDNVSVVVIDLRRKGR